MNAHLLERQLAEARIHADVVSRTVQQLEALKTSLQSDEIDRIVLEMSRTSLILSQERLLEEEIRPLCTALEETSMQLEEIADLIEFEIIVRLATSDRRPKKPRPPTRLAVTIPNGTVVKYKNASDTFVEVIKRLGRRRVKDLNLKVNGRDLMSASEDDQQRHKLGGYWINVGTSTKRKKDILEDIAARLDVKLEVEIIPKT